MEQYYARQRGSVAIFIITAVVLASLALLVLYGVRSLRGSGQAAPLEADKVAIEQPTTSTSPAAQQPTESSKTEHEAASPGAPQPSSAATTPTPTAPQIAEAATGTERHLPQTGGFDMLGGFMMAVLAASVVAYHRSQRLI